MFRFGMLIFIVMALLCYLSVEAQDVLVTKSGDALKVYGVEVGSETVFYQESQDANSPTKRMSKRDLLIIKYADGRVVNIADSNISATATSVTPVASSSPANTPTSAAAVAANNTLIEAYNSIHANFIGKVKNKTAKVLYCECVITDDSKICDDNVELIYKTKSISINSNQLLVTVKNKTDKVVYVDLGNTFFTSEQVAEPYYVPQVVSTTSSTSSGVSVDAGAVASAFGVGGVIGELANGVTIGGGSSHGTSTSTFTQRVIAVPPMSTIELAPKAFVNRKKEFDNGLVFNITDRYDGIELYNNTGDRFTIGQEKSYDMNSSILHFSNLLTYAFDENITSPCKLNATFYVNRVVGVKNASRYDMGGAYWGIDDNQLSDDYTRKLKVLVRQYEGK